MVSRSDILKASILIVDDKDANISLLEQMLRGAGYVSIASTKDPRNVCELHRKNRYDLILLDLQMPGMDGFQVMEDLEKIETSGYLPVLVVTAQPNHKVHALTAGAKDFVSKPFELSEVLVRVYNMIEVRLLRQKAETRSDKAIRASELSYRRLFEAAKDGILILDADTGRISDVNPFLLEMLGFSHDEMVGKPIWDLGSFKDIVSNKAKFEELQQHGYVRYEDLPLETRDGRRIPVEFISNVYHADDRNVIQCNIRDITEHKRAEESLRLSEIRYRRLFETAQDGILILHGRTGQVLDANPFMRILLGYSQGELLGKKLWELGPFKGMEASKTAFAELQKKDKVHYEGLSLQTKKGRHVEVEFVSNAYPVDKRRFIQCNIRDITERRQAEMVSIRLAAIVESSDDAIVGKDLNSMITSWNKGAEKIFGYAASEMIGTSIMRLIPADRKDEENQILGRIHRGQTIEHFEALRLAKDGRVVDVSVTVSPIRNATGNVIGVSKVARDITERKAVERQMQAMQAQLKQTNEDLTKRSEQIQYFHHTLSHELKTPLTSAREFVSIVIDGLAGELNSTQRNYLGIAKDSCTELAVYINDLLDATRLDTGKLHIELKSVSLAAIIHRAMTTMEPAVAGKKIRLIGELDTQLTDVMVDQSRMMQILTNLLNNALKFTSEGGEIIVKLGEYPKSSEYVQVSVTDTGCGIAKDQIDNLFHRFYQIKRGDATPEKGVGLGLYLCREMVLLHGGNIWVESVPGKGSTFSFTIPKQGARKAAQVLIVDDDSEVREALRLVLDDNGFDVATVAGGGEALQQMGQKTPDVVVLDLMMVGLDGPSTLQEIRKNFGPIPVIVHTGYPDSDLMQRALESSPFTLLAKPCPPKQFVETVRRICQDHELPPQEKNKYLPITARAQGMKPLRERASGANIFTQIKRLLVAEDKKEVAGGIKASNGSCQPASIRTPQRRIKK